MPKKKFTCMSCNNSFVAYTDPICCPFCGADAEQLTTNPGASVGRYVAQLEEMAPAVHEAEVAFMNLLCEMKRIENNAKVAKSTAKADIVIPTYKRINTNEYFAEYMRKRKLEGIRG